VFPRKTILIYLFTILVCFNSLPANSADIQHFYPENQKLYDQYPWAATYYYGWSCDGRLLRITKFGFHRWPEHIQSLELAYTLNEDNILRRFFSPIVGVVQLTGNAVVRHDHNIHHTIYEFDPYIAFRWANLPWNHYVNTSFAIGEGVSYATSYITLEQKEGEYTKRLMNYLMFEATFAHPAYPRLQLVARIHHRSGVYGLYHAKNAGSNAIGLGVKYLFD